MKNDFSKALGTSGILHIISKQTGKIQLRLSGNDCPVVPGNKIGPMWGLLAAVGCLVFLRIFIPPTQCGSPGEEKRDVGF